MSGHRATGRGAETDDGVDVWEPTPQEWDEWVDRATADLGISYERLEQHYHEDDFPSSAAKGLWVFVGGTRPSTYQKAADDLEEDRSDWDPTPAEWDEWIDRATANLGTTYEELERQYHEDDFESIMGRGLWVIIGGSRPSTYRKTTTEEERL